MQEVQGGRDAFVSILEDGSALTWGNPTHGGESSHIKHQLKHFHKIQASDGAFAAILADGSVVAWGEPKFGGDCSLIQHELIGL